TSGPASRVRRTIGVEPIAARAAGRTAAPDVSVGIEAMPRRYPGRVPSGCLTVPGHLPIFRRRPQLENRPDEAVIAAGADCAVVLVGGVDDVEMARREDAVVPAVDRAVAVAAAIRNGERAVGVRRDQRLVARSVSLEHIAVHVAQAVASLRPEQLLL